MMRLSIPPLSPAIGAEVGGIDLGAELSDEVIAQIRHALLEHCVLFFRDQSLDVEQHKRLARRFGLFIRTTILVTTIQKSLPYAASREIRLSSVGTGIRTLR